MLVHNIKCMCKRSLCKDRLQCALCAAEECDYWFRIRLICFYVCAEADLCERIPGHPEGATVCSNTSLAMYDSQGPWSRLLLWLKDTVRHFTNRLWFLLMFPLCWKQNPNYKLTMLFICGNFLTLVVACASSYLLWFSSRSFFFWCVRGWGFWEVELKWDSSVRADEPST